MVAAARAEEGVRAHAESVRAEGDGDGELKVTVYSGPQRCKRGERVEAGDQVEMIFTAMVAESSAVGTPGAEVDSSENNPDGIFKSKVGVGRLMPGWDEGMLGLCKGARAILIIPPKMGYGAAGFGYGYSQEKMGSATLNLDVEVVSVSKGVFEPNIFVEIDENSDGVLTPDEILAHFNKSWQDPTLKEIPPGLMEQEDKDSDGVVTWEEFSGPKGSAPPNKDDL